MCAFCPVSPVKAFKSAHAPLKLNRYSYGVQFGINCAALDQSELSNFVECIVKYISVNANAIFIFLYNRINEAFPFPLLRRLVNGNET